MGCDANLETFTIAINLAILVSHTDTLNHITLEPKS